MTFPTRAPSASLPASVTENTDRSFDRQLATTTQRPQGEKLRSLRLDVLFLDEEAYFTKQFDKIYAKSCRFEPIRPCYVSGKSKWEPGCDDLELGEARTRTSRPHRGHRQSQEVGTFLNRRPAHHLIAYHCAYDAAQRNRRGLATAARSGPFQCRLSDRYLTRHQTVMEAFTGSENYRVPQ